MGKPSVQRSLKGLVCLLLLLVSWTRAEHAENETAENRMDDMLEDYFEFYVRESTRSGNLLIDSFSQTRPSPSILLPIRKKYMLPNYADLSSSRTAFVLQHSFLES